MRWKVLVLSNPALHPDPFSAPPPPLSSVCCGKFPSYPHMLTAAWHALSAPFLTVHIQKAPISPRAPDLDCQSAPGEQEHESVIFTFTENHQTGTPTFTLNDDLNGIITYFFRCRFDWLHSEAAEKCCLVAHGFCSSSGGLTSSD